MSSGNNGIKSDFYDRYSFTASSDGMMLGSIISNTTNNARTLLLENLVDYSSVSRSGANVRYPNPGGASPQNDVQFSVLNNYTYGFFPSYSDGFRRNEPITMESSDIYNYSNPGVYLVRLTGSNSSETIPIFSSTAYTCLFTPGLNICNGVILYPGWGFRLFNGASAWGLTFTSVIWDDISYTYFNDTNEPLFFTCASDRGSNEKNFGRSPSAEAPSGSTGTTPSRTLPNNFVGIPIMSQVVRSTATTGLTTNRSYPDFAEDGIQIFYRSGTPLYRFGLF